MFFSRNVFGHDEEVDRDYLRLLFGLYQGFTRPTKVSASPVLWCSLIEGDFFFCCRWRVKNCATGASVLKLA